MPMRCGGFISKTRVKTKSVSRAVEFPQDRTPKKGDPAGPNEQTRRGYPFRWMGGRGRLDSQRPSLSHGRGSGTRRWPGVARPNPFRLHRHGVDPSILHRRDSLVPCPCRTVGDGARAGSSARSSGCVGLACDLNWRSGGVSPFRCLETLRAASPGSKS